MLIPLNESIRYDKLNFNMFDILSVFSKLMPEVTSRIEFIVKDKNGLKLNISFIKLINMLKSIIIPKTSRHDEIDLFMVLINSL